MFTLLAIYPIALWTFGGLSVVVRMFAYLDTRIRLEGWDVELAVRAEAIRQFGEEVGLARPSENVLAEAGGEDGGRSVAVGGIQ